MHNIRNDEWSHITDRKVSFTAMLDAQVFYVISIIYIFIGDTLGILQRIQAFLEKIAERMRPFRHPKWTSRPQFGICPTL